VLQGISAVRSLEWDVLLAVGDSEGLGLILIGCGLVLFSTLVSFAGIPVFVSSVGPKFVEFRNWCSSFGVTLGDHSSGLGFCDWDTGFLRRDSCVPSRQCVLNSSSVVVELRPWCSRIRKSNFVRMRSGLRRFNAGKSSVGWCEVVVACRSLVRVVPKIVAESRPADLCLAGESWKNVGIDLFSYSCLSQDTLFVSTMWV
jgi:hypothetical protein